MSEAAEKTNNIVVFGANGGIGEDVLRKLANEVQRGKNYRISIVSRKGEEYTQAKISELLETMDLSENVKGDLLKALEHDFHGTLDDKDLSKLKPILENADMVVNAAGMPRPNPPPPRSALIYPNSKVVESVATAVAQYAPSKTVLLLGTNPLDNTVQIADEVIRSEWKRNGRTEALPEIKVIGMSGILDEARLKIYTARILNKALRESGVEIRDVYVQPKDVDGRVYGQHGPKMVVDLDSVIIKTKDGKQKTLDEFIKEHNLGGKEVEITTSKKEKKNLLIKDAIKAETIDGGAKIISGLGRSTQSGAAKRIVEMVNYYFSEDKKIITACVSKGGIASGNLIEIGGRNISHKDLPRNISDAIQAEISASRDEIQKDHAYFKQCVEAERILLPVFGNKVAIDVRHDGSIEIKPKDGSSVRITDNDGIKSSLAVITGAKEGEINISDNQYVAFKIEPKNLSAFDTLAHELRTKITHVKEQPSEKIDNTRHLLAEKLKVGDFPRTRGE